MMGSIIEWDGVGPGNVLGGEWGDVWFELHTFKVFDDTVGSGAVTVPEWPPAAVVFGKLGVGGGAGEEVAVVSSIGRWGVRETVEVHLDEGVLWSEDIAEAVSDEKEAIGGSEDGGVEGIGGGVGGDEGIVGGCWLEE